MKHAKIIPVPRGSDAWVALEKAREKLLADDRRGARARAIPSAQEPPELRSRQADASVLLDVAVRRVLQATKFIPEYAKRWRALVKHAGADRVTDALRRTRLGKPSGNQGLDDALLVLAAFPSLGLLGPVDADSLDDFPPGLETGRLRAWSASPPRGWLAQYFGIDTWPGVETGRVHFETGYDERFEPWTLACRIDLHAPDTELQIALDIIRAESGDTKRRRTAQRRGWRGRGGLNVAFRLLELRNRQRRVWSSERDRGVRYLALLDAETSTIKSSASGAGVKWATHQTSSAPKGRRAGRPVSRAAAATEAARLASVAQREVTALRTGIWVDPEWEHDFDSLISSIRV